MKRGQATTEWMLIASVLAIGLALAAYAFLPGFRDGISGLANDVTHLFAEGESNGSGDMR